MIEKYFKCTFLSNVVINSKLATEGNVKTLNYIPGSNFLGIVAKQIYPNENISKEEKYHIFHSGEISFGDAIISKNNELYYPVPFTFMMEKEKTKIGEDSLYLQHLLDKEIIPVDKDNFKIQLKQQRIGYLSASGKVISNVEKGFTLKSAQDSQTRRSKEGAMFGFEYLKKGQEFIFSVRFKDEKYVNQITQALTGKKKIGKSKSAEFGQVKIDPIAIPQKIDSFNSSEMLVYAQSNLCFYSDITGQPTHQPTAAQLGFDGTIDWSKSQIRTYSYSPWNGERNTSDSHRNCILAGSVFVINGKPLGNNKNVGAFQAEGLGRLLINPVFLKGDEKTGKCLFSFEKIYEKKTEETNQMTVNPTSVLGRFLKDKYENEKHQLDLSKAIHEEFIKAINNEAFDKITASQWGAIRTYAIKETDIKTLENKLLGEEKGYLTRGVAYDRIWSKRGRLKKLEELFNIAKKHSKATTFIGMFAGEMANHARKIE